MGSHRRVQEECIQTGCFAWLWEPDFAVIASADFVRVGQESDEKPMDAKQQALPAILEKWLHDLKSNKKVTVSRVFCEIKETVADTIYGGLSVSKTDILKSIANKDAVNLQAILSTIKDSIERDGG